MRERERHTDREEMESAELIDILSKDFYTKRIFCGVFPSDRLPRFISPPPGGYVINTHPEHLPGEHWVAVWIDKNRRAEFF